jgi:hypothetical protein
MHYQLGHVVWEDFATSLHETRQEDHNPIAHGVIGQRGLCPSLVAPQTEYAVKAAAQAFPDRLFRRQTKSPPVDACQATSWLSCWRFAFFSYQVQELFPGPMA